MNILGVNHTDAARCSFLSRRIMARVNGFSQTGKLKFRVKLFETQVVVDSYLAIRWMISVGTWKPGAQRFGDSGLLAGSQTVSRNVCSSHYPPRVNIERNNNYCLIGRVGFCRQCFTPSNKGSRNCPPGDNTNNNRSSDHASCTLCGNWGSFGRNFGLEAMQSVHIKYELGAIL